MSDIYQYSATAIDGSEVPLADYRGKVMLIVNTASNCGFTPQYKGLEALHQQFKDQGVEVLGFPCNQFGGQEPGSEEEISQFCELNFGVTFPLFSKIDVNGPETHPLFAYLKKEAKGVLGSEKIKWNFTKFLVDQNGTVLKRYGSIDKPEDIAKDIAKLVA